MKIFLIRHAEAIEYETDTVREDEYRYITPHGRKVTGKVIKILKDELKDLDRIFTSPLIRAVQTAEVTASALEFEKDVELVNEMKNESTTASLQEMISRHSDLHSIALVGHEPKIGHLVKSFSDKEDLQEFRKSSVCLIEYDLDLEKGKFVWYFDSKKMEFIR